MATAGVVNTKLLKIYVGATAITCQTDGTLSMSSDTRDTTCKDSGQWKEALYGQTGWEISGTALGSYDGTMSLHQLTGLIIAQTVSTVSFKTAVSGDDILTGTVIWTKMDIASAGTNQNVTISYTGMGTGALVQSS
jgi:predicted secreted protein